MDAFTTLKAVAVPVDIANCDTDQIIPARFLRKPVDDPDYPTYFFHDLRFDKNGEQTDFVLNRAPYQSAQILVTEKNWGCGSSRENAVTAMLKNGFRSVIAPSVADIHYSNCMKRGVLPVRLTEDECAHLRSELHDNPGAVIAIDLAAQSVVGSDGTVYQFDIDDFDKQRMLNGWDDIDLTLQYERELDDYEARRAQRMSWLRP